MHAENPVAAINRTDLLPETGTRMPVLFIGHGSPEFTLGTNEFNTVWKKLGREIPKPSAILCISAHWVIQEGLAITAMKVPKTIHDFYGFPEELYEIEYSAPGSPEFASRVQNLVQSVAVDLDYEWGLDHGTWSVLRHMYPDASIPVVQLSLNYNQPPDLHFRIGQELKKLRDHGVLIIGSGNLVHNLMMLRMGAHPYPWAVEFDEMVKQGIAKGDFDMVVRYVRSPVAHMAHPTNEHLLPLLYVLGAAGDDSPRFFTESIFAGSVSMRSVAFGLGPS